MQTCANCGSESAGNFCSNCGARFASDAQAGPSADGVQEIQQAGSAATLESEAAERDSRPTRGRRAAPAVVAAAVAVLLVAVASLAFVLKGNADKGGAAAGPTTHTIHGTMTISGEFCDMSLGQIGKALNGKTFPCESGSDGYDDIANGTQVNVTTAAGKVIAYGTLSNGRVGAHGASWQFTVPGVPDVALYRVEVSHRGALSYSRAELAKKKWKVDLSLG